MELEVARPDAQQRMIGREPGGSAPRAEAGRDVLLGDLLLASEGLVEALRVAVDDEQRPDRRHEPGGERHLQTPPVGQHEEAGTRPLSPTSARRARG